jgi:hypothetical protein
MARQPNYRYENGQTALISPQTDNYTLTPNDNGAVVTLTHASAKTITVPTKLPVGFNCVVIQLGAGVVTVDDDGTTTIHNVDSQFNTGGQYAAVTLVQISPDVYILAGATA